jgi:hypothetical protein
VGGEDRGYQHAVEKCGSRGWQHSFCEGWNQGLSVVTMWVNVDRGYQHSLLESVGARDISTDFGGTGPEFITLIK